MKHFVLGETALSWRQPSIDVASTVPFALPFFCQMERATLQSKLTRPQGCAAGISKYPTALGWHKVDMVKFHTGAQVGGGHGVWLELHEPVGCAAVCEIAARVR